MPSFSNGDLVADRFEIVRPLGVGGLAEVYAARDRVTSADVAIKVLHPHLAHDEKLAERFRRELAATRALDHVGIVRVFDLHTHQDGGHARPVLAMELLHGRTLAERLSEGPMQRDEAFAIARKIAEALHAAHGQGIIHRDLKPQNVMLGEDGSVKLLDFGLARAAGWARLTAQSTMLGTPSFMAPELFAGQGADSRADLYALGATLFEMLTGRPAFAAADPFEVVRQKGGPAPSARAAKAHVSAADDALIRRALDPDPELRFLDAAQLLRALGGAPPAPPPIPAPRVAAGDATVEIHHGSLSAREPVQRLLKAVGSEKPDLSFWLRLRLTGTATLATGVSRETADSLVALGTTHSVPSLARPERKPGRFSALLAKLAAPLGALVGGGAGLLGFEMLKLGLMSASTTTGGQQVPLGAVGWASAAAFGLVMGGAAGFSLWAQASAATPALAEPRRGDPTVWRVLDGIERRVVAARKLAEQPSPPPMSAELAAAARRMGAQAEALAAVAALIPDPLSAHDPDAFTLPPGALEQRDAAMARLLAMAASLDEALAAATSEAGKLEQLDAALVALEAEASFAGRALPEVRKVRAGEPPEEVPSPPPRQRTGT